MSSYRIVTLALQWACSKDYWGPYGNGPHPSLERVHWSAEKADLTWGPLSKVGL